MCYTWITRHNCSPATEQRAHTSCCISCSTSARVTHTFLLAVHIILHPKSPVTAQRAHTPCCISRSTSARVTHEFLLAVHIILHPKSPVAAQRARPAASVAQTMTGPARQLLLLGFGPQGAAGSGLPQAQRERHPAHTL